MKYKFEGKTVVITGASSGIGREMASRLVTKYGCTVYGIARREALLLELAEALGERFIPYPMDATSKDSWQGLADKLNGDGVIVDTLINCAGMLPKFASVENSSFQELQMAVEINFYAQIYATEAILPIIKKSSQGGIISFSSSSALCPFAGVSAYCASKSASRAYFECMARENKQVYIATIMNGFVKTDIMKNQDATERDERIISKVCADLNKTVNKIMKKIRRKRSRIIVGADAHLMNFMYKLFPRLGPKIITKVLKKARLEIFKEI